MNNLYIVLKPVFTHLQVAAVDSLTNGQYIFCLPKMNNLYIVLKPVFTHLQVAAVDSLTK